MKLTHLGPINRTLFILVIVAMLPVVAILLYSGLEHRKLSIADAEQDIFLLTRSMAEVQHDLTHSVRQTLTVLSLLSEIQSLEGAKVSAIFKSIIWQNKGYHNLSLVNLDGTIVASAKPFSIDVNLGDRKHVREAIDQRRFSVGEFIIGRDGSSIPTLAYAFPVFNETLQLIAVLTATITLDYFTGFHEFANMPENSFISATDHQGVRLFYYPPRDETNPVGKPIKATAWAEANNIDNSKNQGSFAASGSDGIRRIFAFEQIRISKKAPPYMYVWVGIPEKHVLNPAREALVRNMLFLFASMVMSLILFLLIGKKILTEPINRLVNLTQKFAEGRLMPCAEPSSGPEELRVLNDAFFDMATDLNKSQRTIRESEYRFREIFNNMSNGVVILESIDEGKDFIVKDINPAGLKQGSLSREALVDASIFMALPQIFDIRFHELLQRVYQTESPEYYPVSKYEDDNVQLWIESYVFKLPAGEIVVVCDDITERKQGEEERSKSEVKFRAVIDQASDAIYVFDEDGNILLANKRAYESLGYRQEELLRLNVKDIDPTFLERNDKQDTWQPLQRGDTAILETVHKDKSGRVFPVEVHVGRVDMGNQKAILGMVRDISSRKEFEASLKRSKEEWENTFNAMSDIITIQDKNMNILKANKAFYEMFPGRKHLLSSPPCYEIFHGNKTTCKRCPAHKTFADGNIHREEITDEKKGRTYSVSTCPILAEDGKFEHIVHIVKDITQSKKLEEELFQSHKMEAIGTLAGGIAHDFNNILSAIMGFAEFIKEDVPAGSQPGEDAEEILSATNRAKELVKQILTFSRKNDQEKSVIEPRFVVQEALNMLRSTFPTSVIIIEDIQRDCGTILANSTNLHQVVLNLCANARYAMEDDKGMLRVELKRVERNVNQLPLDKDIKPGQFVELLVADNGCGMTSDDLERIFEPYYTTRDVGTGSGLGLSVTHGIVEDCNGFIEVESELGKGTTFAVYIPCHDAVGHTKKETPVEKRPVQVETIGKILMVDDEPPLLKINSRRLRNAGYQVVTTESSNEALKILTRDPSAFDLLITDQTMPELTGEDLAREVLKRKPSLPIIVCTGHSESFSEEKALAMGIKKYVFKPILGDGLTDAVKEVLDS